jgi:hypothetical protein
MLFRRRSIHLCHILSVGSWHGDLGATAASIEISLSGRWPFQLKFAARFGKYAVFPSEVNPEFGHRTNFLHLNEINSAGLHPHRCGISTGIEDLSNEH